MSIRLGNNIVAGRSPYQPSLFDFKWADHVLTDPQWVRADTNLWHNRSVFTPAYDHLLADIRGKEAQSETIEGVIITYYLASDGHKICLSDQVNYLNALYEKTGVAWYYMIDTTTQSFKVPRSKWNVVGIRSGVHDVPGKFETFALPNAASEGTAKTAASQMYLYFYIGNFTQTAIENTAGANLEDIEAVMDDAIDAVTAALNSHRVIAFQAPTSENNYTWYRKYADGWVEMGGAAVIPGRSGGGGSEVVVNLPVAMADTTYQAGISIHEGSSYWASWGIETSTRTTTTLRLYAYLNAAGDASALPVLWEVKGIAAQ